MLDIVIDSYVVSQNAIVFFPNRSFKTHWKLTILKYKQILPKSNLKAGILIYLYNDRITNYNSICD